MIGHGKRASDDEINATDEAKHDAWAQHAEANGEKGMTSDEDYDMPRDEEQRMVRKCDWRILPVVSALYIMSFLNRVNIGESLTSCRNLQSSVD